MRDAPRTGISSRRPRPAACCACWSRPSPRPGRQPADAPQAAGGFSGYMTMIEDMTQSFDSESKRDQLLQDLTESSRGPVGNLRAAAETLYDYSDMGAEDQQRFLAVVRDEAAGLATRVEAAARTFAAVLKARWPLEEMLGADLLTAARRRIADRCGLQVSIEDVDAGVWLKVDGFSMLQAMTYFAARLRDEYKIRDLQAAPRPRRRDGACRPDLVRRLHEHRDRDAVGARCADAGRRVVAADGARHRRAQRRRGLVPARPRRLPRLLPLPAARHQRPGCGGHRSGVALADSRPEFYDFDLFKSEETDLALDDRVLAQLAFTVFDTETTGLEPSAGDEIIQIGAVRIVNRRLLRHEAYEQLIDPQRSLPPASVKIHGITPEMLAGQPPIAQVLPVFRAFVADTVLVAHNAAFDMRFLELKEAATGIRFDRPVLDTFLLSAVLFPNQETHRLEAIAERLGVSVMGRHTAVGDAIVTAEVFLKMLPLLAEKGIRTLGQAREASEKTYHARITY
jgi:DNA polymerase-3 subunit epsilon